MANRLLSLIGWLGVALAIAAFAIRFGLPAKDQYAYYLAWAGLVCVLAYSLGQWRQIAEIFNRRQTRYGTMAAASVLIVLGILVAVNYIGVRQNKRWDLTSSKQFSLSDQTRGVLSKLDSRLDVLVFAKELDFQEWQDRLKEYSYASKQVSAQYIDPDKKPAVARQNQVQQYGTVVFAYKGRTERVTSNSEQDLTNGIIKVVSGQQKKVYFTQGHGERDAASQQRDGYNGVSTALGRENYAVDKVVLAQTNQVPDDAMVVVVAGPKTDFFQGEIDALKKYLSKSGKLLLELDPPDKLDGPSLTSLIALAREWGIDVGDGVVVDTSGIGRLIGTDESVPVAATYPQHPITDRFNLLTAFPLARPVLPASGSVAGGHVAQTVVQTSERSWAESDVKALLTTGAVRFDESKGDRQGPVSIAAAVTAPGTSSESPKPGDTADAPKPEVRVVVIGDSDFAANSGLGIQGNRDLFMNIVGWLSQQENLIAIRPKEPEDRRLTLTSAQQTNVAWLVLVLIPCFTFGAGVYTWWRRR